ncbi:zinc finger MYM-type protein 1-like [Bufo gargarizans]|uniref:zinc finger MYM-type protein 1-like n=1 Tax=Bufo gargarizans TaxID=30331 RepID=UPI001CF3759C|nr:zinc finger MYM-type protein 1-like [Bufo gargarizans]
MHFDIEEEDISDVSSESDTESIVLMDDETEMELEEPSTASHGISSDPAFWPENIDDQHRITLIKIGPVQEKAFTFPKDDTNRSFSISYYQRVLDNGEKIPRNWLIYSTANNSVQCFACRIFNSDNMALASKQGFNDWQHLTRHLSRHEKTTIHITNYKKWMDLSRALEKGTTIDHINQKIIKQEEKRWYSVIQRIIYIIQYLAGQNLALRGCDARLFQNNNGNFLKLVEMIGKFDPIISEHIQRIQCSISQHSQMPHYLGYKIQNEIIAIVGTKIREKIIRSLNESKYFSIILDCTPDMSHTEQISIVVRFVVLDQSAKKIEVREHFLDFCPVNNTTSEGLTSFLLAYLKNNHIAIENMRGQGYDNGANMKGKHNGLQQRILNINPRAFFVPCSAHTLNLVVNDAAKISFLTIDFFGIVQELYVFFASSTQRWQVLKEHVTNLTLKPLSETRWESRVAAIKPLRYFLPEVFDALYDISDDDNRDINTKHQAQSLATKIKSFKFICSIVIWYELLSKVNVISKIMQQTTSNLSGCVQELEKLIKHLVEYRSDEGFENALADAKGIAEKLDCEAKFPDAFTIRPRRKKKIFDYEHEDESLADPTQYFKVNFFFAVLDTSIQSINERFTLLQSHCDTFAFLYEIPKLGMDKKDILKCSMDLQNKLTDSQLSHSDINGIDLCDERDTIRPFLTQEMTVTNILQYLVENNLTNTFPNLSVSLRILMTLPVSVAAGERSFSKLKLIKNYLRSTMSQARLTNLSIISIEKSFCEDLDIDDVIRNFAVAKARRVRFV